MSRDKARALELMRSRLADCERAARVAALINQGRAPEELAWELPNMEDVLSIDTTRTVSVLLGCGGPTTYIDYRFNSAGDFIRAEYVTTDTPSGSTARVELDDAEAETFADTYCGGIDTLAGSR